MIHLELVDLFRGVSHLGEDSRDLTLTTWAAEDVVHDGRAAHKDDNVLLSGEGNFSAVSSLVINPVFPAQLEPSGSWERTWVTSRRDCLAQESDICFP